jgi:Mrp family chromosome partitioning ATPase
MSRNFDVLRREAVRAAVPISPAAPPPHRVSTARSRDRAAVIEDEIMKLVQQVFVLPSGDQAPGAIAFCALDKGAGCSWVCARVSEMLAEQVPGRVCIVDANLRSPSLHEHFRIGKGAGFSDAMKSAAPIREFVRPSWNSHLWFMSAGAVASEPNRVLNPARLHARFAELRAEFDYVLVDTAPMGSHADALLLGQLTDGVVLVVGSNVTRRETARIAKESLEAARIPVLGAVLNKRTYPIPEALYQRL